VRCQRKLKPSWHCSCLLHLLGDKKRGLGGRDDEMRMARRKKRLQGVEWRNEAEKRRQKVEKAASTI
jgi:hypothetical protein